MRNHVVAWSSSPPTPGDPGLSIEPAAGSDASAGDGALLDLLEEARRLGFLGPGPVGPHLVHALGFATVLEASGGAVVGRAADLGSGAGVPGLPLAVHYPSSTWVLIESGVRRSAFLRSAVAELGLGHRVAVVEARAEEVGRRSEHRGGYDIVVARGFGPPAVVAECAAPLLRVGGRAVVSEPPGGRRHRWPEEGLALLGMAPGPTVSADGATYQVVSQVSPCPDGFPRRVGAPAKRPLFGASTSTNVPRETEA